MNKVTDSFLKFWLPVYLYAALIYFLSSIPGPSLPLPKAPFSDKFLHIIEYAILGYLLARAFSHSTNKIFSRHLRVLVVAIAVFYGISDEIHQAFVPERVSSAWDVVFDGIGAFLGSYVVRTH